jgi:hypothetical protein
MVKEGTFLVFTWKLHLQLLRYVFCVIMVVHGLMRHHRQSIDQECTPWCGGILSSWSFLPTCEMVSSRVMKIGHWFADTRWVALCFSSTSYLDSWKDSMLGWLWHYSSSVDLFVHFLWVSASIVDPFYGTCFISPSFRCWSGGSTVHRFIPNHGQAQLIFILSYKMLVDTYPWKYNKFEIWV